MKIKSTIITFILAFMLQLSGEQDPPLSWNTALPLQAAVCDVIGLGYAVTQDNNNIYLNIDQFWYGDVTNNPVLLRGGHGELMPTNNIPVIFFASKYQSFLSLRPPECHFSYIFDMDYHRSRHEPDGLYLYDGDRSWFPATPENADMTTWCSNLVYVSQVNTNRQAFYELIRDGYRLNPPSSRIHRDSEYTFQFFRYYNDTNFMRQVWSDTNLVGWARAWVNMSYQEETREWLD
ncbi:MAG: hypothetical protein GX804_11035 [Lentisphaerae bacterium]|jgi:hypothetical protein|nr:hypothetical protein [Lentisphaerota bacterium]